MYLVFQKPNSELWSKYYIRLLRHSPDCFSVWGSKCNRLNETVRKEESSPDLLIESCLTAAHRSREVWGAELRHWWGWRGLGTGHNSPRSANYCCSLLLASSLWLQVAAHGRNPVAFWKLNSPLRGHCLQSLWTWTELKVGTGNHYWI